MENEADMQRRIEALEKDNAALLQASGGLIDMIEDLRQALDQTLAVAAGAQAFGLTALTALEDRHPNLMEHARRMMEARAAQMREIGQTGPAEAIEQLIEETRSL